MLWLLLVSSSGCASAVTPPALSPTITPAPTLTPAPTEAPAYGPAFTVGACPFEVPKGYKPICGTLTVPEDRSQPAGRTIHLSVAIFKSVSPDPELDPVIQLAGGPGSSPLTNAQYILAKGGDDILARRDYILFDQRGVGYSDPNLYCQAYDESLWSARELDLSPIEYNTATLPALGTCLADWRAQGINLAAYNTVENAADVNDLRLALGYDKVNLYGTSYGTNLALTVMRHHPEGIRSVILDSVDPPQADVDLDLARHMDRALGMLFSSCAESASCSTHYGDLKAEFYATVDRLEASPVVVETGGPYRDSPYRVVVDGDLFIDAVFGGLYSMESISDLPRLIQVAYEERYSELADLIGGAIGSPLSTGMFWATWCREQVLYETDAGPLPQDIPPQLSIHFGIGSLLETCQFLEFTAIDPVENEPVASDLPTLIFSGLHDPITPPGYAETVAETLSHHYIYIFPNMAHGVMRSDYCALRIGMDFLDDPTRAPDTACMAGLSDLSFP